MRVDRLDLEVLGRIGVDHPHAGIQVVDQHDGRLATRQGGGTRSRCTVVSQLDRELGVGGGGRGHCSAVTSTLAAISSCSA